ncbi:Sirohydrochlorin cobaltochelatase [Denitrovibrio acetiphilus DSM 12809]|uniref:Sirohydrochlorin cobaltochelatase n=1 Tax=Denitrovibrio acetiphilus (strain DSM 12809 / NBRC 114555 / N2460) TaxID=522772 RepID=D4H1Z2_DENA2|nr:sirohydrochlorin cobaltochelatase [Denitrovibrio acetiphilus]ADD66969.1 Sirohydrochlorin cobaltochelatase [Denitrovibrio acetiphilus DSM 12809]
MRILSLVVLTLLLSGVVYASGDGHMKEEKSAIVITAFGTSYESTLNSILAIVKDTEKEFPQTPVRLAFTSNIIRKIWNQRDMDEDYKKEHPEVPAQLYKVKNVLGAVADLQNEGYRNIVVQSTHVANGEEFQDLESYVNGLRSIHTIKEKFQPFNAIALGKPLTGTTSHAEDVEILAKTLGDDIKQAEKEGAALVYMGHGNEHMAQGVYYELEIVMNRMYDVPVAVGLVEGLPDLDTVLDKLKNAGTKKVLLKPLMIVAGDHANNDMAGDEDDAWKTILTKAGYDVDPVLEGLGDKAGIRKIFIKHIQEAAAQVGIALK